jgi:hypothetical protein
MNPTVKQIQYNTASADMFVLYLFSDIQKFVLCIVSEIRYDTIVLYQKNTTHFLANLDCFQQFISLEDTKRDSNFFVSGCICDQIQVF